MIQFFSQMLKLPVAAVAAGLEIVARIARDVQQTFDRNVDVVAESMAQSLMDQTAAADIQSGAEDTGQAVTQDGIGESDPATQKDGGNMGDWDGQDQDLSGDDLKVVQYRIIFTKRDYEATLYEHEETINYSTNGGGFGAEMISNFTENLVKNGRDIPNNWKDSNAINYPPSDYIRDGKYYGIPGDDRKYITFLYEVKGRFDRQKKEYDKEQVKILQQIRERL